MITRDLRDTPLNGFFASLTTRPHMQLSSKIISLVDLNVMWNSGLSSEKIPLREILLTPHLIRLDTLGVRIPDSSTPRVRHGVHGRWRVNRFAPFSP